ncbi:hypothetical protein B0J14DRAFT_294746 [Halenospora varia]|nr:hypothetical protein B0J14DRAFT_294746 [Halenospora varia]
MPRPQRRPERQAPPSDVLPTNNLRPEVRIEQLGEGCIVWLPAKDENEPGTITCIRNSCCSNRELTKGGYNHPVLLLKIKQDGICSFAQVTSKQQKSRNRRDGKIDRLPIYHPPTDPEAAVTTTLYLEKGRMNRESYVRTNIYSIYKSHNSAHAASPSRANPSTHASHSKVTSILRKHSISRIQRFDFI